MSNLLTVIIFVVLKYKLCACIQHNCDESSSVSCLYSCQSQQDISCNTNTIFNCYSNAGCIIDCSSSYCDNMEINNYGSGIVNILCHDELSCNNINITTYNGYIYIFCSSLRSCNNINIQCFDKSNCFMSCSHSYSCNNSLFSCNTNNGICTLNCNHNPFSCINTKYNCYNGKQCNLLCNNSTSCHNTNILCNNKHIECNSNNNNNIFNITIIPPIYTTISPENKNEDIFIQYITSLTLFQYIIILCVILCCCINIICCAYWNCCRYIQNDDDISIKHYHHHQHIEQLKQPKDNEYNDGNDGNIETNDYYDNERNNDEYDSQNDLENAPVLDLRELDESVSFNSDDQHRIDPDITFWTQQPTSPKKEDNINHDDEKKFDDEEEEEEKEPIPVPQITNNDPDLPIPPKFDINFKFLNPTSLPSNYSIISPRNLPSGPTNFGIDKNNPAPSPKIEKKQLTVINDQEIDKKEEEKEKEKEKNKSSELIDDNNDNDDIFLEAPESIYNDEENEENVYEIKKFDHKQMQQLIMKKSNLLKQKNMNGKNSRMLKEKSRETTKSILNNNGDNDIDKDKFDDLDRLNDETSGIIKFDVNVNNNNNLGNILEHNHIQKSVFMETLIKQKKKIKNKKKSKIKTKRDIIEMEMALNNNSIKQNKSTSVEIDSPKTKNKTISNIFSSPKSKSKSPISPSISPRNIIHQIIKLSPRNNNNNNNDNNDNKGIHQLLIPPDDDNNNNNNNNYNYNHNHIHNKHNDHELIAMYDDEPSDTSSNNNDDDVINGENQ